MSEPTECIVAHDGHMGFWYTGEEIVRCRDCKFLRPRDEECGGRNWCKRMSFEVTPDGFCAWGERKVDA